MQGPAASNDDTDESLMRAIRFGSHQAFSILVRRHTDRFYASACRLTGNPGEAEDLVQEAFLKIWNRPDIWKDDKGARFTTWFHRILINQNIDRLRKRKNMASDNTVLEYTPDNAASPERQTIMNEEQERLERAIGILPERQKTALNLCFYEGLSNIEAAGIMGVKVKALESLLMRAKAGVKEFLNANTDHLKKGGRYATR